MQKLRLNTKQVGALSVFCLVAAFSLFSLLSQPAPSTPPWRAIYFLLGLGLVLFLIGMTFGVIWFLRIGKDNT